MSKSSKHRVLEKILNTGLLPVFFEGDFEIAKNVVKACLEGGAKTIEFTNRGDRALDVFNNLLKWCDAEYKDAILGAGTIIEPSTASQYINSGANFIVGPSFNSEVAKICHRRRVLYIPGCMTPTEISEAEEMGIELVKLFPACVLTPMFVKAILGPSPRTLLMPSGGVKFNREEVMKWIEAGAVALNVGSELVNRDLVMERNFEAIRENVKQCLEWIKEAKRKKG
ncbi:bifunctional 4-hydroxy-2-oxoglutarate aldolase/2-dehydro-3-deoxy-phosphogluconate aldolase [Candidatus Bathyarchaeota archaeon]|nr:bifunctional 4-hydroxy-2-oxoglutarate aldolase/2-dehydro-3-deoxy-phosphogluconate aldolase [Candidatus Bathyarchaeota archaeon]